MKTSYIRNAKRGSFSFLISIKLIGLHCKSKQNITERVCLFRFCCLFLQLKTVWITCAYDNDGYTLLHFVSKVGFIGLFVDNKPFFLLNYCDCSAKLCGHSVHYMR